MGWLVIGKQTSGLLNFWRTNQWTGEHTQEVMDRLTDSPTGCWTKEEFFYADLTIRLIDWLMAWFAVFLLLSKRSYRSETNDALFNSLPYFQPVLDFFGRPVKVKPKDTGNIFWDVNLGLTLLLKLKIWSFHSCLTFFFPGDKTSSQSARSQPSLIWFRFNEGYSNAVRKSVKVLEFL